MQKPVFLGLVGLALLGAGCGPSDSPVSLDKYQVPRVQLDMPATEPVTPSGTAALTETTSTNSLPKPSVNDVQKPLAFPGVLPDAETANKIVRIKTAKGEIVFELLPKEGPNAASNFVSLASRTFYDGLTFHRVVPGFVIQGGDPSGNGTGGPGYRFKDDPVRLPYLAGVVAMANAGPDTNGSQFFIMLEDNPLPPNYSIFGRVVAGMDVVRSIQIGDVMTSVTIEAKK